MVRQKNGKIPKNQNKNKNKTKPYKVNNGKHLEAFGSSNLYQHYFVELDDL